MTQENQEAQIVSAIVDDIHRVIGAAVRAGIPPVLISTAMDVATAVLISSMVRPESWDRAVESHMDNLTQMLAKYREQDALQAMKDQPTIITEL